LLILVGREVILLRDCQRLRRVGTFLERQVTRGTVSKEVVKFSDWAAVVDIILFEGFFG